MNLSEQVVAYRRFRPIMFLTNGFKQACNHIEKVPSDLRAPFLYEGKYKLLNAC